MRTMKYLALLMFALPAYATNVAVSVGTPGHHHPHPHHGYYHWEAYRGYMPPNAVVGGQEAGRNLFVCQTAFRGTIQPGKVVARRCNITYAGQEIPSPGFAVLVGQHLNWVPFTGMIPPSAVVGGTENGQPLFVCQAYFAGGYHPGKVVAGNCNIGYGGNEVVIPDYHLLVSEPARVPVRSQAHYSASAGPSSQGYYSAQSSGGAASQAQYSQQVPVSQGQYSAGPSPK